MQAASKWDGGETGRGTRRRGTALENAILDAAWSEVEERGYPGLTLEAVAKRAGTSRPVIHRRWPSRSALAVAALARHVERNPITIPDLGCLRDELMLTLRRVSDRARPDLIRLMFEMSPELLERQLSLADIRAEVVEVGLMEDMLKRGIARGEVDPARLTPRIAALPGDLARNEITMTFGPVSDAAIREIVDDIFLPLVRPIRP